MCVFPSTQSRRGDAADSLLEEALAQQIPQNPPSAHTCANKGVRKTTKLQQVAGKCETMCKRGAESLKIDALVSKIGVGLPKTSIHVCSM